MQIESMTVSTWEDIGRSLYVLSEGLAHFDSGTAIDVDRKVFRDLNDLTKC